MVDRSVWIEEFRRGSFKLPGRFQSASPWPLTIADTPTAAGRSSERGDLGQRNMEAEYQKAASWAIERSTIGEQPSAARALIKRPSLV
jgi:hypothetical protein